jgi:ubiquinol-cytochrome c reductase cytochrome b subunit
MYSYHVLLLPVAVIALVVAHVLLVRKHGVVPPFELAKGLGSPTAPKTAPPRSGAQGAPSGLACAGRDAKGKQPSGRADTRHTTW